MKTIQNAQQAAVVLLDSETSYGASAIYYRDRGTLKHAADMTSEEKEAYKECREAVYQLLSKREGKLAARAALLFGSGAWVDLPHEEKKALQDERNRVNRMIDNRWSRLRNFVKDLEKEKAEKEAAESGEPQTKAKKTQRERWAAYEIESVKANKKYPEADPTFLAELQSKYWAALEAHIAERKKTKPAAP